MSTDDGFEPDELLVKYQHGDHEHDLDAEQAAFRQRRWYFEIHRPVPTTPPNPPDPSVHREFLAQAWKKGTTTKIEGYGKTEDEARADLLDKMFEEVPITDK